MAESGNKSMADFLVTFFTGDRKVSRLLSDVLINRNNRLFLETLGVSSDFVVPFSQEDNSGVILYTLKKGIEDIYDITLNGNSCNDSILHSGDYYTFSNKSTGSVVKTLLISTSDIKVGYKKYNLARNTNIFIGRASNNDISYDYSEFISREKHIAIRIDGKGDAFVEDLKRSIGVYVNDILTYSQKLNICDEIFIMGLSLVYMGDFIAVRNFSTEVALLQTNSFVAKIPVDNSDEKKYFVSSPRIVKSLDNDAIEIEAPPSPFRVDDTPAILTIGPSLTMSIVMLASLGVSVASAISGGHLSTVIASGVMAIGMLVGSLMWPSLLRSYQKRRVLAEEANRKDRYSRYILNIENEVKEKRERAVRILNDTLCPSPDIMCSMLDSENTKLRLWERSYEDEDFLYVRMGLGDRPFDVQLKIPKQGFQLYDDELRNLPWKLSEKYAVLDNVPLTIDFRNNRTLGLIGSRLNMCTVINEIILNIISLHSYDEVKLVIVASPSQAKIFNDFKNVPHIWSTDKKVRFYATNPDEVHYIFGIIDETIKERLEGNDKNTLPKPHFVLIVMEPNLIEREALLRYINNADNKVGITTIFAYGDITMLPKSCKTIIQSYDECTGYYSKNKNDNKFISFILDDIEENRVHSFANELSKLPIKRDARSLGIVDSVSFLQMYKVGNVAELSIESHWDNNNSAKSLAAPIGVMAGGDVFNLDLHESYHGCHGLVAGTTGSGKSEFLQAFILSLAVNYSPKEVAFVLVDFKGGDMARPFMPKPFAPALPHLAATISNLSGNTLYRALVSLEAEIKSRQRIINEAAAKLGVDKLDINSYHKYYKGGRLDAPLPHLIIIIDEFAQLKTQQPEFLAQLINVAQVGRSLGIHLILATQKPSGIVDPQIMSNSRFKVCLKVADKQDSIDMINKLDSAMIKNPGRLYLQVGYDEVYECVQSGYTGADYVPTKTYMPDEEITVQMTDNTANPIHSAKLDFAADKSGKTQLEVVVAEIIALGQKKNIVAKPLWLDVLPERVALHTLNFGDKGLCSAGIGLADYVRIQEQRPLNIDFIKNGHVALYGASGTGKTTFLQTLIHSMVHGYGYTPEELNIYAMDFGGRNLGYLADLPHTGGVVFSDDENKVLELNLLLHNILDERKKLFEDNNCGTFVDYRVASGNKLPAIIVIVDNYEAFREKYMDVSDEFTDIISAGKTFGIYFVITGSTRNAIYYKVTEHISSFFTLKMNDPSNYFDILNMRPPVVPEDIAGRGITVVNKEVVEFQTAVAFVTDTEAERLNVINQLYYDIAEQWCGYEPIKLCGEYSSDIEETIDIETKYYTSNSKDNTAEALFDDSGNLVLGTSKSGASLYGIKLLDDYKVCICANDKQQLKKYYSYMFSTITKYDDRRLVFIDDEREIFKSACQDYSSCEYISSLTDLDTFIEELKPELNARLENAGDEHEEIFIVISEFGSFFEMITNEQADFMRKVLRYMDNPEYKICFITGFDVCGQKNNDILFMSLIIKAKNYMFCPGTYELATNQIESLPLIQNVNSMNCYLAKMNEIAELRW